ncbi:MAG: ATP-dependent helicase [Thermodesulfobacteriota bacterium]
MKPPRPEADSAALAGLNPAQRYAVSLGEGPILVIAGAGSGKTRTLVHRVAWLVEQGAAPGSILLLTFTRKAAQEMLSRARGLHPDCAHVAGGTFHSLCHRLLRAYCRRLDLPPNFTVLDRPDCEQIVKGVVEELRLKDKGDRQFPKARGLMDLISKSRNQELSLAQAVEDFVPHLAAYRDQILAAGQGYAAAKRAQALVDYDDLLFMAEGLLRGDAEVRHELHRRWRHLLVDEYQDTNAVQARLVELLTDLRRNVMAVGDDAQSIYAFRGARVQNILEFPEKFPNTRLVKLEQNYRSTQPILDLTNQIIAGARQGFLKRLFTEQGGGPRPALLRPRDERGQSRAVMERIRALMDKGARPDDVAVLFRAGNDSADLEVELTAAGLAYVKVGGLRFLEAAHIKDALSHLRVAANPQDYLSWQRVLMLLDGYGPKKAQAVIAHLTQKYPPPGYVVGLNDLPASLGGEQMGELAILMGQISDGGLSPLEATELVLEYYEPLCREAYEDWPRRLKDLEELPNLARQYERLEDFMAEVALEPPGARGEELTGGRLTLTTIHSAKGLEWDHVFLLWAAEGRLPAGPALGDPEALEEERRLMYVACTRARKGLTISAPREYYARGQGLMPVGLSRFLEEVPAELWAADDPGPVFNVPSPAAAAPASRGSRTQARPFPVGSVVNHAAFGQGKVMGYKGDQKIMVHFGRFGLKVLMLQFANLSAE